MSTICIIPCGKKKIWDKYPTEGSVSAEKAYIGTFHRLAEQYAKHFFNDWLIISAMHGFLRPDDIVPENYDLTFGQKGKKTISLERLKEQVEEKNLERFDNIVVLTGKKYQPIMSSVFMEAKCIQFPLEGSKGIGEMQARLKNAVLENKKIHDEK